MKRTIGVLGVAATLMAVVLLAPFLAGGSGPSKDYTLPRSQTASIEQDSIWTNFNEVVQETLIEAPQENESTTAPDDSEQDNENEAGAENEDGAEQAITQPNTVMDEGGAVGTVHQSNVGTILNETSQGCIVLAEEGNESVATNGSNQSASNSAGCANLNSTEQAIAQANTVEYGGTNGGAAEQGTVQQDNVGVSANETSQDCGADALQTNISVAIFGDSNQSASNSAGCVNANETGQGVAQTNTVEYGGGDSGAAEQGTVQQDNVGVNANETSQDCGADALQTNISVAIFGDSNQSASNSAGCVNANETGQGVAQTNTVEYGGGDSGAAEQGTVQQDNVGVNANETSQDCGADALQTNVSVAIFGDSNQSASNSAGCVNANETGQGVAQTNTVEYGGGDSGAAEQGTVQQDNVGVNANETSQDCGADALQTNVSVATDGSSNQSASNSAGCANLNSTEHAIAQANTVEYGGTNGGAAEQGTVQQDNVGVNANETSQDCIVLAEQGNESVATNGDSNQSASNSAGCVNANETGQGVAQTNTVEYGGGDSGAAEQGTVQQDNVGVNANETSQDCGADALQTNVSVATDGSSNQSASNSAGCANLNSTEHAIAQANTVEYGGGDSGAAEQGGA